MTERNYNFPPLNQYALWNRRVEGEEQHNNVMNIMHGRHELDDAATRLVNTGTPETMTYDDLDRDTLVPMPLDWDLIEIIDHALKKGELLLEKEGIVFDPKWETAAYWQGEAGEDTND